MSTNDFSEHSSSKKYLLDKNLIKSFEFKRWMLREAYLWFSASYLHQRNADVNSTKISFNLDCNLLVYWAKKVIVVLPNAGNVEI